MATFETLYSVTTHTAATEPLCLTNSRTDFENTGCVNQTESLTEAKACFIFGTLKRKAQNLKKKHQVNDIVITKVGWALLLILILCGTYF